MSGMLSTGLNGLRAFQSAIDVTSQNVVNVDTDGYVRQRAELATRPAIPSGGSWLASGVKVAQVVREVDQYLIAQSRDASTTAADAQTRASETTRLLAVLGNGESGLAGTVTRLRDAFDALAAEPASTASRAGVLTELNNLVDQLHAVDTQWTILDQEWSARLSQTSAEVAADGRSIADLNRKIAIGAAAAGTPSPSLLDQRDRLLDHLAGCAEVRVVDAGDGKVNVFVGRGRTLVVGDSSSEVTSADFTADSGGSLGALVACRETLGEMRSSLLEWATAMSDGLNAIHRSGVDALGRSGSDLLAYVPATTSSETLQSLKVLIGDPSRIAAANVGRGSGDNGNARALVDAFTPIVDGVNALRLRLANQQRSAEREADVRVASKQDIDRRRSNLSGVNLDEEAARLLQLQHAYQAAAQVVRMSDELFRTLLDAAR